MARFLDKYVKDPLAQVLASSSQQLPEVLLQSVPGEMRISVGNDVLTIKRNENVELATSVDEIPSDDTNGA